MRRWSTNGDFVITWSSDKQDGDGDGVFAREYDAAGVAKAGEFQVNSYSAGNQRFAAVSMDASGNYVIVWSGEGDGDSEGVWGRRYKNITDLTFSNGDGFNDATVTLTGAEFVDGARVVRVAGVRPRCQLRIVSMTPEGP